MEVVTVYILWTGSCLFPELKCSATERHLSYVSNLSETVAQLMHDVCQKVVGRQAYIPKW